MSDTLRIIHMQAEDAEIEVTQTIPEDLVLAADRRAVKQILLNLLSNAVKFTPAQGQISVTARCAGPASTSRSRTTEFGISRDAMERLGHPFEQVQDQFTKDHKGTGLDWPSPARCPSCMAGVCASARRLEKARSSSCACR